LKSDIPHNIRAGAKWRAIGIKHIGICPTKHLISTVPGVVGEYWYYALLHIMEVGVTATFVPIFALILPSIWVAWKSRC